MSGISIEKLKAGVFDGPQIRKLMNDPDFENIMNVIEGKAWISFVQVSKNFLGNHNTPNYAEIVQNMNTNFRNLECNRSIKVHYLDSHLDRFPKNLGDFSEEQGERFHQDIKIIEER